MTPTNRVKWHGFLRTRTYSAMQAVLWIGGYQLDVILNEQKVAVDVFVRKIR